MLLAPFKYQKVIYPITFKSYTYLVAWWFPVQQFGFTTEAKEIPITPKGKQNKYIITCKNFLVPFF